MANSSNKANGETGANKVQLMLSAEELLSLPVDALFSRLETTSSGLSSEEVAARLEVYGTQRTCKGKKTLCHLGVPNELQKPTRHHP